MQVSCSPLRRQGLLLSVSPGCCARNTCTLQISECLGRVVRALTELAPIIERRAPLVGAPGPGAAPRCLA